MCCNVPSSEGLWDNEPWPQDFCVLWKDAEENNAAFAVVRAFRAWVVHPRGIKNASSWGECLQNVLSINEKTP